VKEQRKDVARKLPPADNARGGGGGGGATAAGCPLRITRGAAVAAVAPRPTALMAMSAYAHSITWTVADDDDVLTEAESSALIQAVMAMEEAMIEGQGTGESTFDWSTWKKGAWKKVLYATKNACILVYRACILRVYAAIQDARAIVDLILGAWSKAAK
jgi:hypothetical protein